MELPILLELRSYLEILNLLFNTFVNVQNNIYEYLYIYQPNLLSPKNIPFSFTYNNLQDFLSNSLNLEMI